MVNNIINLEKAPCIYWSNKLKCEYLQRQILVHSYIYYELNNNIITDKQYDSLCKMLLEYQKQTKEYKSTEYYYVFKEFTGETGFYLYHNLNKKEKAKIEQIANHVLRLRNG